MSEVISEIVILSKNKLQWMIVNNCAMLFLLLTA